MKTSIVLTLVLLLTAFVPINATAAPSPEDSKNSTEGIKLPPYKGWTIEQAKVNLKSSNKSVRLAAARRLGTEKVSGAQQFLAEAARFDPEARIRFECVQILAYRNEPASLPIIMHIADTDKNEQVRNAAKIAVSRISPSPTITPQPANAPAPAPTVKPTESAKPVAPPAQLAAPTKESSKHFDKSGNELPPNYLDTDLPSTSTKGFSDWNMNIDNETLVDKKKETVPHSGFLPSLGFDGALGMPRNTLPATSGSVMFGYERGSYSHTVDSTIAGQPVNGYNDFTQSDFSMLLMGRWSPTELIELGLDLELFTAEKLEHNQKWKGTSNNSDTVYDTKNNNAGYSGGALGFLSMDVKSIFIRKDTFRAGLALRFTIPTHTGDKFDKGLGASDLFLPMSASNVLRKKNETANGKLWGMEPGIVASWVPVEALTIYADLTFMMTAVKYELKTQTIASGTEANNSNDIRATSFHLIQHLGAQYRVLDNTLGFQLAIAPVIYMGKEKEPGFASLGISPGIFYKLLEMVDLNLVSNIEVGSNSAKPLVCTNLLSDPQSQKSPSTDCGVGRRFGLSLSATYKF